MKILITGMTSAQTREEKNDRYTVAGDLASLMRMRGLSVEVTPFDVTHIDNRQLLRRYDRVVIGVAPIRGLTSAYMYGALGAAHLFGESAAFYHEDIGGRNALADLRSVDRTPTALVDPFHHYKRGYLDARDPDVFPDLANTVHALAQRTDERWHEDSTRIRELCEGRAWIPAEPEALPSQ